MWEEREKSKEMFGFMRESGRKSEVVLGAFVTYTSVSNYTKRVKSVRAKETNFTVNAK